jgi:hypothetical protein
MTIKNEGIGPALVTHVALFLDDEPIEGDWADVLRRALSVLEIRTECQSYKIFPGTPLPPREELDLLRFPETELNHALGDTMTAQIERLKFSVAYESMYKQEFVTWSAPKPSAAPISS